MDSLQALDRKIGTTIKLQGIVKSMKALAAVNIRQYEKALASLETYVETIELGLAALLREQFFPGRQRMRGHGHGILLFGSDQGLCGRFNERLADFATAGIRRIAEKKGDPKRILVVGARIGARIEALGRRIDERFWTPGSVGGINTLVYQLLLVLEGWMSKEGIWEVEIFANSHDRLSGFSPYSLTLLPLHNERLRELRGRPWPGRGLPDYRISSEQLFSALLRHYLFAVLYNVQARSLAAEQATRLLSLRSAEKNIEEHIDRLRGEYRVRRQTAITSELLDLVAGFKATARAHRPSESGAPR